MSKNINIKLNFPVLTITSLIFMTLKLTGVINWSWWWVFSPLWLPVAVFLVIFGIIVLIANR